MVIERIQLQDGGRNGPGQGWLVAALAIWGLGVQSAAVASRKKSSKRKTGAKRAKRSKQAGAKRSSKASTRRNGKANGTKRRIKALGSRGDGVVARDGEEFQAAREALGQVAACTPDEIPVQAEGLKYFQTAAKIVKPFPKSDATMVRQEAFCIAFAQHAVVAEGCRVAGVVRPTADHWKANDPHFVEMLSLAYKDYVDSVELVGSMRAKSGKSDTMNIFYLKAHKPDRYSDKITVEGGRQPINVRNVSDLGPEDLAKEILELEGALGGSDGER